MIGELDLIGLLKLAFTLDFNKTTHLPQVLQKQRAIGVPLLVSVSLYSVMLSSPWISTLFASIARLAPKMPPATRRQLRQWHRCPRRLPENSSVSWTLTVTLPHMQWPSMVVRCQPPPNDLVLDFLSFWSSEGRQCYTSLCAPSNIDIAPSSKSPPMSGYPRHW
jgi:hypothetical protein